MLPHAINKPHFVGIVNNCWSVRSMSLVKTNKLAVTHPSFSYLLTLGIKINMKLNDVWMLIFHVTNLNLVVAFVNDIEFHDYTKPLHCEK